MADAKNCGTCRHWSQWLPSTGDCMRYAHDRREALMTMGSTEEYRQKWPIRSAAMTGERDSCDKWEAKP